MRLSKVVGTQYAYRLRAYSDFFNKLIIFQVIAGVLSLNPIVSMGMGSNLANINLEIYSTSLILSATMLWSLIMGLILAQKQRRAGDFRFVGNQLSLNLANILFLLTSSIIAGLTTVLSNGLLKIVLVVVLRKTWMFDMLYNMTVLQMIQGTIASILYILLFGAFGYWIFSMIAMRNKVRYLLGALVLVMLFMLGWFGKFNIFEFLYEVYFQESIFWLFVMKMLVSIAVLLGFSTIVSNELEVRR